MREALNRWLKKQGVDLSTDTAHLLCDSLGLDGEKIDSCLGLCYQLEKGEINEADFTGGLCVLASKKPEEVAKILRKMGQGKKSHFAFYDRPTDEAKLVMLYDRTKPEWSALDVGAEFVGEYVEILSDITKVGRLWTAKTEKGSIFKDRVRAFTVSKELGEKKD